MLKHCNETATITGQSPDVEILWRNEKDWAVEHVTEGICQFGYDPEDFLSGKLLLRNIIHPDDIPRVVDAIQQGCAENRQCLKQECRLLTRSGEIRWIDIYTSARSDFNGNITHYHGAIFGINKRKTSEKRHNELLCLYNVSKAIGRCNSLDDICQAVALAIPAGWMYPEITRALVTFDGEAFASQPFQETEWVLSSNIDVEGATRGSVKVFYAERCPDLDEGPFLTEERALLDSIARRVADSAELLIAKEAVNAERQFRKLFDLSSDAILTHTLEGQILDANQSAVEMLGRNVRSLRDMQIFDFCVPDDLETAAEALNAVRENGSACCELRFTQSDNNVLDIQMSQRLVDEAKGVVMAVAHNVTKLRLVELELRQAQKLKSVGQLAAGIAHEINTPTQYVGDNIQFLRESFNVLIPLLTLFNELVATIKHAQERPELLPNVEEALEKADIEYLAQEIPLAIEQSLEGLKRVTEIVSAMKNISRPGVGHKVLVDINKAIESTITVARNEWKYVSTVETDLDPSLPHVPCFAAEFNQVILNLIVNATEAIGRSVGRGADTKGTISISTRSSGGHVEIRVGDTGGGIPEEIRNQVFDPFFTTKDVGGGLGQGLSFCHAAMTRHNGSISLETKSGEGTVVTVLLPVDDADAREKQDQPNSAEPALGVCR